VIVSHWNESKHRTNPRALTTRDNGPHPLKRFFPRQSLVDLARQINNTDVPAVRSVAESFDGKVEETSSVVRVCPMNQTDFKSIDVQLWNILALDAVVDLNN
jgi:hypothetical protein